MNVPLCSRKPGESLKPLLALLHGQAIGATAALMGCSCFAELTLEFEGVAGLALKDLRTCNTNPVIAISAMWHVSQYVVIHALGAKFAKSGSIRSQMRYVLAVGT